MSRPRVVHVTPARAPLAVFAHKRQPELERIFGPDVEIVHLSPVDFDPPALVQAIRQAGPDAVVLASASADHRRAVEAMAGEMVILRPVYEQFRTRRGVVEQRQTGFGCCGKRGGSSLWQTVV